jgi:DNA-binding response OmpR family regulator
MDEDEKLPENVAPERETVPEGETVPEEERRPGGAILIVDDEQNIRLALKRALEVFERPVRVAGSGEEAMEQLEADGIALMLLDLKLPRMDGMKVLRRVSESWPQVRVIVITAHGSVAHAVEAMRLGAVDFVEKPFAPDEIRGIVRDVLSRDDLDPARAHDFADHMALAKRCVNERRLAAAIEHARRAVAADPQSSEGFNLLGALYEISGHIADAQKHYRVALDLDPTNRTAAKNLERSVARSWHVADRRPDLG